MEKFCNEAYYRFFGTLANLTRLAIIDAIRDGPKTVSEISDAINQKPAIVAQNLEPLVHCVLVRAEGNEEEKRFALNREIVEPLGELLSFHVTKHCPGLKECIPEDKLKEYMKREAAKEMYIERE